jgi:hypothetical protein
MNQWVMGQIQTTGSHGRIALSHETVRRLFKLATVSLSSEAGGYTRSVIFAALPISLTTSVDPVKAIFATLGWRLASVGQLLAPLIMSPMLVFARSMHHRAAVDRDVLTGRETAVV